MPRVPDGEDLEGHRGAASHGGQGRADLAGGSQRSCSALAGGRRRRGNLDPLGGLPMRAFLTALPALLLLGLLTVAGAPAARADEEPKDESAASKAYRDAWWAETGGGN